MDNELQALLISLKMFATREYAKNPKGGVKTKVGSLSFESIANGVAKLESYFGVRGCFSIGICLTCDKFNTKGHTSLHACFGTCPLTLSTIHAYDSCNQHHATRSN